MITWSLCTADIETTSQTLTTMACPMWPHPWLRNSVNVGAEENMRAAKHKYIPAVYRGQGFSHAWGQSGGPDLGKADTAAGSPWGTFLPRPLAGVGNSKSSNLASQAAITPVATRIGSEKILQGPGFASVCVRVSVCVESMRHGNAYSAVTIQSKWSLKYCKALHSTAITSLSEAHTHTHILSCRGASTYCIINVALLSISAKHNYTVQYRPGILKSGSASHNTNKL